MRIQRRVLLVAGTMTSTMRLLAVLPLVEADPRVQVVFTHDEQSPSVLLAGVPELLAALQVKVLPWSQAKRLRFDLILTASEKDQVHLLDGPAVLFAHGAGHQKHDVVHHGVAGLSPDHLLHDGKIVHAAIALAHSGCRALLMASCPEALDRAVVVGDPCVDAMLANLHRRARYRDALGVGDRHLVVLTSTWGGQSLLGQAPDLPERVLAALPYDGYRCCLLTHPGIVAVHGERQLRAWLARAEQSGLMTIPLHQRWEPILISADCVVADQGSMSVYAAAMDLPLLMAGGQPATTVTGSAVGELATRAPRLDPAGNLRDQIESVIANHVPGRNADLVARTIEEPGTGVGRVRQLLYQLMELPEPDSTATLGVLSPPLASRPTATAFTVTTLISDDGITIERTPTATSPGTAPDVRDQHLVAHAIDASNEILNNADIIYTDEDLGSGDEQVTCWAASVFQRWPRATVAAALIDERTCRIVTTDQLACEVSVGQADAQRPGFDPLVLVSVAYLRLRQKPHLTDHNALVVRDQPVSVDFAHLRDVAAVTAEQT